jgi:hypothetical protein
MHSIPDDHFYILPFHFHFRHRKSKTLGRSLRKWKITLVWISAKWIATRRPKFVTIVYYQNYWFSWQSIVLLIFRTLWRAMVLYRLR